MRNKLLNKPQWKRAVDLSRFLFVCFSLMVGMTAEFSQSVNEDWWDNCLWWQMEVVVAAVPLGKGSGLACCLRHQEIWGQPGGYFFCDGCRLLAKGPLQSVGSKGVTSLMSPLQGWSQKCFSSHCFSFNSDFILLYLLHFNSRLPLRLAVILVVRSQGLVDLELKPCGWNESAVLLVSESAVRPLQWESLHFPGHGRACNGVPSFWGGWGIYCYSVLQYFSNGGSGPTRLVTSQFHLGLHSVQSLFYF